MLYGYSTFTKEISFLGTKQKRGKAMWSNHFTGFYCEVKKGEWRRIIGPLKLRRKADRKKVLGELRPSEDGKIMRINVAVPHSLMMVNGAAGNKMVQSGCVVNQRDFTIMDDTGMELHVIWSAGSASPAIDFTEVKKPPG